MAKGKGGHRSLPPTKDAPKARTLSDPAATTSAAQSTPQTSDQAAPPPRDSSAFQGTAATDPAVQGSQADINGSATQPADTTSSVDSATTPAVQGSTSYQATPLPKLELPSLNVPPASSWGANFFRD